MHASPDRQRPAAASPGSGGRRSSKFRGVSWHKHRKLWQVRRCRNILSTQ